MGSRLLSFSPVDRNFLIAETSQRQDDGGGWALPREEIKDHIFLILKVKETLLTTHEQKGSLEIKKGCGVVEFCPKATTVRPCTKATEAEPRTQVTSEAD